MSGLVGAVLLALAGLGLAAAVGRKAPPVWQPGLLGGITGGCGVGAIRLAGFGDIGLGALAGLMVIYGALVGATGLAAGRTR